MAGKTIEESITARRAAEGGGKSQNNLRTGKNIKNGITVKGIDGQAYPNSTRTIRIRSYDFADIAMSNQSNSTDIFEYQGFMAIEDDTNDLGTDLRATIDWANNSTLECETIFATSAVASLGHSGRSTLSHPLMKDLSILTRVYFMLGHH